MQKKTFTKWVNAHLARASCRVGDLYADLRDGYVLTRLLEVLSGEQLVRNGVPPEPSRHEKSPPTLPKPSIVPFPSIHHPKTQAGIQPSL